MSDCYIGRKKCGCAVAAIVIDADNESLAGGWRKHVAKTVAEWIRDGLLIERVTAEAVRGGLLTMCECGGKKDHLKQSELSLGGS